MSQMLLACRYCCTVSAKQNLELCITIVEIELEAFLSASDCWSVFLGLYSVVKAG